MYGNGQPMTGDLVRLFVRCADRPSRTVLFKCAVMDECSQSLLLAANVVNKLMDSLIVNYNVVNEESDSDDDDDDETDIERASHDEVSDGHNHGQTDTNVLDDKVIDSGNTSVEPVQQRTSEVEMLRNEQLKDDSLETCFFSEARERQTIF